MKQTELLKLLEQSNISKNSYDILDKGFVAASEGYLVVQEDGVYCLYYCERGKKDLLCTAGKLEIVLDEMAQELASENEVFKGLLAAM